MLIATDATGTPTSPDSIATILPSDLPAVTTLTSGVNAIAATVQTALTNSYLRKTSGNVVNADINAAAAIAYTKLNLATSIVNADIAAAAAIVGTKIATGTITSTNILDGTILNADINASAAITTAKLAATPYCLAYRTLAAGTQSFGAANGTISFSTAVDNATMWAGGAPTRVTVPTTGSYRVVVSAAATYTGGTVGAAGDRWVLQKNAVNVSQAFGTATSNAYGGEVGFIVCTAGDFFELVFARGTATAISTDQPYLYTGGLGPQTLHPASEPRHYGALLVQFLGT